MSEWSFRRTMHLRLWVRGRCSAIRTMETIRATPALGLSGKSWCFMYAQAQSLRLKASILDIHRRPLPKRQ